MFHDFHLLTSTSRLMESWTGSASKRYWSTTLKFLPNFSFFRIPCWTWRRSTPSCSVRRRGVKLLTWQSWQLRGLRLTGSCSSLHNSCRTQQVGPRWININIFAGSGSGSGSTLLMRRSADLDLGQQWIFSKIKYLFFGLAAKLNFFKELHTLVGVFGSLLLL